MEKPKNIIRFIKNNKFISLLITLISIFILTIIIFVISTSSYLGMYADDYCTSNTLQKIGYWQSQSYWYLNWSGRYSFNLFIHFSEIFKIISIKSLPVILYISSFFSFFILIKQFFNGKKRHLLSALTSLLFTSLIIVNSPDIFQSFFWQTGSLTYFIPLIFLNFALHYIFKYQNTTTLKKIIYIIIIFLLSVLTGGFSESNVILQTGILYFILIISIISKNKKFLKPTATALFGSLISIILLVTSPGTRARQSYFTDHLSYYSIIKKSIIYVLRYLHDIIFINHLYLFSLILILVIGISLATIINKSLKLDKKIYQTILILNPLFVLSCIFITYASSLYAMASPPPNRTLSVLVYILILGSFIFGVTIGNYYKMSKYKKILSYILSITLIFVISLSIIKCINIHYEIKQHFTEWDNRNQQIINDKNNQKKDILVKPISQQTTLLDDMNSDSKNWANQCASNFYNVDSITVYQ